MLDINLFNSFSSNQVSSKYSTWKVSPSKTFFLSKCGLYNIIGGVDIFSINSTLEIQYLNLSHHFKARTTFFFIKIDFWNNNNFFIKVDGLTIYQSKFNYSDDDSENLCGSSLYPEAIRPIDLIFNHSSTNLLFDINTDISNTSASWGIFNFSLALDICDSSCNLCNDFGANNCTSCYSELYFKYSNSCNICTNYFFNTTCVNQCPDSYFIGDNQTCVNCDYDNYFVSENKYCEKCDVSCKTCDQSTNISCLSCYEPYYLNKKSCVKDCPSSTYKNNESRICSQCHYSCLTCLDADQNSCTSCEPKTRIPTNITFNATLSCNVNDCSCIPSYYDINNEEYCFGIIFIYLLYIF